MLASSTKKGARMSQSRSASKPLTRRTSTRGARPASVGHPVSGSRGAEQEESRMSTLASSHRGLRLPHKRALAVLTGVVVVALSVGVVVWASVGKPAAPAHHTATHEASLPQTVRTDAGAFTVFSDTRHRVVRPRDIVAGPDGNLWFTAEKNAVGRITPTGDIDMFTDPAGGLDRPDRIVAGPDGALWVAAINGRLGRVTTSGQVTTFAVADDGTSPVGLAAGPDGNVWYTLNGQIGRITPTGQVTTFDGKAAGVELPAHSTAGPDGNVWFTDLNGRIGRVTPDGQIATFDATGADVAFPGGIVTGADGNLWFTSPGSNRIGRITRDGRIDSFDGAPAGLEEPSAITAGPDGNL